MIFIRKSSLIFIF